MPKISPFLWFDNQAEEAARFYTRVFKNSRIHKTLRYGPGMPQPEGSAMTVDFELDGQAFTALNGGPEFQFTEAISFVVHCDSQQEVDYFWEKLTEGGEEQECGWLKDRYGVVWQIVPDALMTMLEDPDAARAQRVTEAMLQMKKLDLPLLQQAYAGSPSA